MTIVASDPAITSLWRWFKRDERTGVDEFSDVFDSSLVTVPDKIAPLRRNVSVELLALRNANVHSVPWRTSQVISVRRLASKESALWCLLNYCVQRTSLCSTRNRTFTMTGYSDRHSAYDTASRRRGPTKHQPIEPPIPRFSNYTNVLKQLSEPPQKEGASLLAPAPVPPTAIRWGRVPVVNKSQLNPWVFRI